MKKGAALFRQLNMGIEWLSGVHIPQLAANTG